MNYDIKMDVPAKYFGTEVNKLLDKLSPGEANKIKSIPLTALMTGNFKNPKISTDMRQATTNLASQIIKLQKEKLINQGASALGNILGGGKKNPADTTSTKDPKKDAIKNAASDLLNGLFGKKK